MLSQPVMQSALCFQRTILVAVLMTDVRIVVREIS